MAGSFLVAIRFKWKVVLKAAAGFGRLSAKKKHGMAWTGKCHQLVGGFNPSEKYESQLG